MTSAWDSWAEHALQTSGKTASHHAGIYGLDGTCWGGSDQVAKNLPKDFFGKVNSIMSGGAGAAKLEANGKSFITLRADSGLVVAKSGQSGVTISKGNQSFVVGFYDDDSVQPNNNCTAVCGTCDKLKASGY